MSSSDSDGTSRAILIYFPERPNSQAMGFVLCELENLPYPTGLEVPKAAST